MKKYILDLRLVAAEQLHHDYCLLRLQNPSGPLPTMLPGQFVQVRIDDEPHTMLRRPISINLCTSNELWLLVHAIGPGTRRLASLQAGDTVNAVLPLGRGFTLPEAAEAPDQRYLLVGGGVGTAPLLFLGQELLRMGSQPTFLLGARTADDLLQLDLFSAMGPTYVTTEDGSAGEKGFVTHHSLWQDTSQHFTRICTCGPKPMMWAVAKAAEEHATPCEASLENMMACGLGACLCCVENTVDGNVCVCQEGPVFDTRKLRIEANA